MSQLDLDFTVLHTFLTHPGILVRRARRNSDGRAVILKRTAPQQADEDSLARLAYEHAMLLHLHAHQADRRIIAPVQLWGSQAETTLVLEDIDGTSLHDLARVQPFPLDKVLELGQQVAEVLAVVHAAGVLHKDVNPRNIVYNPESGALQLIDFGIAVRLDREVKAAEGQQGAEGTLAYAPPEQVGRMARYADHRSDYYSLGATLYALLCGRPPFVEETENKLMHSILTATPVPPHVHDPRIPEPVSQLVMRLLDKMQERRYRSARGIAFDLGQCRDLVAGLRTTVDLGKEDRSERFELPDKLYGRTEELQALHKAFREATGKRTSLVFLGGPSGMGKSSLVNELQAELVGFDALFASGKHDQLRRHMPFSALSQAISGLVRGFLFEPEAQLNYWRRSIQAALGQVAQALIEVVPAIELLLGPQPPVSQLPTRETENRLHYLLQRLINALAADRPMLLFLDDLQWSDHGTIKLLRELLYSNDVVAGLCIVAAYRDNEVPPDHPLAQLLDELHASERPFTQIILQPLAVDATRALLQDSTGAPAEAVRDLAPVVHAKTHGNPFFARAYLQHLNREGLLRFDTDTRHFKWDLATIQSTSVTDNVVSLLSQKIRLLNPATQRILSTAACLGNQFHMRDLEVVAQVARAQVAQAVNDGLGDGLIVPLSNNYRFAEHTHADHVFKFAHDRIQQAVFELMPAADTLQVQRTIGLYLWERLREEPTQSTHTSIFDTLGHLNAARDLFQADQERTDLAQLNLTGAREAKRAGALAIALTYLQHAAHLLSDDAWERLPQLKRGIELELADNEFLSGHIDAATGRLVKVVERSDDVVERAEIEIRRVTALTAAGRLEAALEAGVHGLRALGLNMPLHPRRWHQVVALVRLLIALIPHKLKDLPNLPECKDPRQIATIALLNSMKMGAFYASPMMFAMLALVAPLTTVRFGSSRDSSSSMGLVALVLVQLNLYQAAKVFAGLAREGARLRPDSLDRGSIEFSAAAFVDFIDLRPDAFMEQMRRSYFIGLEAGDPLFGGWAGMCGPLSLTWVSFSRAERELHAFEGYIRQRNEPHQMITLRTQLKFMQLLRGDIDLAAYKAEAPRLEADALRGTGAAHWVCLRVAACWLCGDIDGAWEAVQDGRAWRVHENMGEFMMPFLALYATLTFCARRARGARFTLGDRGYALQMRLKLRAFAIDGRINYAGLNTLAQAMDLSSRNRLRAAERLFDRAIEALSASDCTILRATAMECGGRYYMHLGRPMAARGYLDGAVESYRTLGAEMKSQQLEQEFSLSRTQRRDPAAPTQTATRTLVGTSATRTRGTKSSTGTGGADQLEKELDITIARRLGAAALQEVNQQVLADTCLAAVVELSAATRAIISLGQPGTPSHTVYDSAVTGALVPDQLLAFAWRTRETVFNNNVAADAASAAHDPYLATQRPQCYCCLPMLSRGRATGVIYLENTVAPDVFTSARLASLTHAAVSITVAFELHQHRHQLTQLAAAQASALRDAADRVVQRERESTETQLAGGFAHEMRNALTAAAYPLEMLAPNKQDEEVTNMSLYTTYSELLSALDPAALTADQLQVFQDTNEVLRSIAQEVNRGVNRALILTKDILDYAQASRILPGNHRVRLKDVCQSVLEEHRLNFEANGIVSVLDIPDSLYASISEPHAYAIARNLISNARDAVCMGDAQRPRRIEVRAFGEADRLHLKVQDSGVGMDAAQAGRVFQPFFTTKGTRGTGLGLGFARKVLTAYGGKIDFESTEGVGTTFEVELPVAQTDKAQTDKA